MGFLIFLVITVTEIRPRVGCSLLPPLPDTVVKIHIFPRLVESVGPSMLWRLRRVNRTWYDFVGSLLEWCALEFVRLDAPGYLRKVAKTRGKRASLSQLSGSR